MHVHVLALFIVGDWLKQPLLTIERDEPHDEEHASYDKRMVKMKQLHDALTVVLQIVQKVSRSAGYMLDAFEITVVGIFPMTLLRVVYVK